MRSLSVTKGLFESMKRLRKWFPKPFLIEPLLERLQINVWFLAIFPLLMTNGKNLFSGIDQAVKNYGDHDHKK